MTVKIPFILIFIFLFSNIHAESKVFFSPNGGCENAVIEEITKAQKTIDIAMYYFTSRKIAEELVKAKERGVQIRIVLDKSQETQAYSKSRYLLNKGIDVRFWSGSGLQHNKFVIIDQKILITGSFNWTPTAENKNAENLLVMDDNNLIKKYRTEFEELWKQNKESINFMEN